MKHLKKSTEIPVSLGAAIVALGVVYGDIGTSPIYVMKSIIAGNGGLNTIDDNLILGALSLVIWTVTSYHSQVCPYRAQSRQSR